MQLCSLLFKIKEGRKSPECELWRDGKRISEADIEYDTDRKMFKLSISHFESELKGKYECVVSTAEEPTVSTAVEVIVDSDFGKLCYRSTCSSTVFARSNASATIYVLCGVYSRAAFRLMSVSGVAADATKQKRP